MRKTIDGIWSMKKSFRICAAVLLFFTISGCEKTANGVKKLRLKETKRNLQIDAKFLAQRKNDQGYEAVPVKENDILFSDDNIKIDLKANMACYVDVILFSSTGQAQHIFPNPAVHITNRVEGEREYFIPTEDDWFFLDNNAGLETIYVIANSKPLENAAELMTEMEKLGRVSFADAIEESRRATAENSVDNDFLSSLEKTDRANLTATTRKRIDNVTKLVFKKAEACRKITFIHRASYKNR